MLHTLSTFRVLRRCLSKKKGWGKEESSEQLASSLSSSLAGKSVVVMPEDDDLGERERLLLLNDVNDVNDFFLRENAMMRRPRW